MIQNSRPEPKILRTKLVRGVDGRLQIEPRVDEPKAARSKWPGLHLPNIQRQRPKTRGIDITIRLPKLRLPKFQLSAISVAGVIKLLRKLQHVPRPVYGLAIVAVVLVVAGSGILIHNRASTSSGSAVEGAHTITGPTPGTPDYSTLLPGDKTVQSLGGWYRVSPPSSDPVYAFADHIGMVQIDVSEQPLPESFRQNTAEQVAQLAQGFSASQKIVASNTTFYIGTSAKGPQSIILTKNNLLILIKSTDTLSTDQWIGYISSLQ